MCRAECFKMQIKVNKMKYLIECMDEEGNLLPLLVSDIDEDKEEDDDEDDEDEGEEVYIETPEQLYDFIKQLEKKPKK